MPLHWASDDEIHNLFIDNCGNETMADILRSLRVTTYLFHIERLSKRFIPDSQQHERIEAHDPEAAREALRDHLGSWLQVAVRTIA